MPLLPKPRSGADPVLTAQREKLESAKDAALRSLIFIGKMARLDGETSNALFETLSDWNIALKDHNLDSLPGPPCP